MSEEYLTVSQAAARLGVSERTIQRRCKSGKLAARLVTTDDGQEWHIMAATLPTGDAIAAANVPTGDDGPGELETDHEYSEVPPSVVSVPTGAATSDAKGDDSEVLTLLKSENEHLRAQVDAWRLQAEAANRTAAETAAALREALKAMPKQLMESATGSTFVEPEKSTQASPPPTKTAPMEETPAPAKTTQQGQRSARELAPWQVVLARVLGIR